MFLFLFFGFFVQVFAFLSSGLDSSHLPPRRNQPHEAVVAAVACHWWELP